MSAKMKKKNTIFISLAVSSDTYFKRNVSSIHTRIIQKKKKKKIDNEKSAPCPLIHVFCAENRAK